MTACKEIGMVIFGTVLTAAIIATVGATASTVLTEYRAKATALTNNTERVVWANDWHRKYTNDARLDLERCRALNASVTNGWAYFMPTNQWEFKVLYDDREIGFREDGVVVWRRTPEKTQ